MATQNIFCDNILLSQMEFPTLARVIQIYWRLLEDTTNLANREEKRVSKIIDDEREEKRRKMFVSKSIITLFTEYVCIASVKGSTMGTRSEIFHVFRSVDANKMTFLSYCRIQMIDLI